MSNSPLLTLSSPETRREWGKVDRGKKKVRVPRALSFLSPQPPHCIHGQRAQKRREERERGLCRGESNNDISTEFSMRIENSRTP